MNETLQAVLDMTHIATTRVLGTEGGPRDATNERATDSMCIRGALVAASEERQVDGMGRRPGRVPTRPSPWVLCRRLRAGDTQQGHPHLDTCVGISDYLALASR